MPSDSTSVKLEKKRQRKQSRKIARLAREKLKQEDPFSYYFGKIDQEKLDSDRRKSRRARNRSTMVMNVDKID